MIEKRHSRKLILFLFLVLTVILSSVIYAAASSYLEIKGTARIENYNWSVHFDNLQSSQKIGEITENSAPYFNEYKTIISGFDVTFKKTTDKIIYEFDIVNDGDIDAVISSIVVNNPVCLSNMHDANNEKEFCDNLKYNLMYEDQTKLGINDVLDKKTKKRVQLVLEYEKDEFPNDEIEMNNISVIIGYSQK